MTIRCLQRVLMILGGKVAAEFRVLQALVQEPAVSAYDSPSKKRMGAEQLEDESSAVV